MATPRPPIPARSTLLFAKSNVAYFLFIMLGKCRQSNVGEAVFMPIDDNTRYRNGRNSTYAPSSAKM